MNKLDNKKNYIDASIPVMLELFSDLKEQFNKEILPFSGDHNIEVDAFMNNDFIGIEMHTEWSGPIKHIKIPRDNSSAIAIYKLMLS